MKVLLTDGSGLTSRQVANRLAALGHHVGVLSGDPIGLTRFTRATKRWHRAPPFGAQPLPWLEAALSTFAKERYELLFPTQEQVAVLAAFPDRLQAAGVRTVVPSFEALRRVQDKLSATSTLSELGIAQPHWRFIREAEQADWDRFPAFVKVPIGTASTGVRRVDDLAQLRALLLAAPFADARAAEAVLVQESVEGPLVMTQAVFSGGRLVAFHANERVVTGAGGGASHKRSLVLPEARAMVERLGSALGWHGALSADLILSARGPLVIDVNPRLVEPMNGHLSGVDLVAAFIDVAVGGHAAAQPDPRSDVHTHQLLLAVLGAAQRATPRSAILRELLGAARHTGRYHASVEELTPLRRDLRSALPTAVIALATLVQPRSAPLFASQSVTNYSLTPAAWRTVVEAEARSRGSSSSAASRG